MPKLITVTEMSRSFSDIVGRVHYQGEVFDIKKGANIVARLMPAKVKSTITAGELNEFFLNAPHLSTDDVEEFAQDIKELKSLKDTGGLHKWD
jgi:antitoxin (DNA-binding transcriptional repressor) of toxin-antitoxin stability system